MCSRYTATADPIALAERFGVAPAPGLKRRFNVAPGQDAAVVLASPAPRMSLLRWGLLPSWAAGPKAKPQINARAESLADRPFFRESFRWRRALVPADGWFEWPKRGADKSPRLFRLEKDETFAFAGLWEAGSFAIVTVEPNPMVARIHDRMPAVLARGDEAEWLDAQTRPERLRELLRPYPSELLRVRRVGVRISDATLDEPSLLDEAASPQGELFGSV